MNTKAYRSTLSSSARTRLALLFVALLAFGNLAVFACRTPSSTPAQASTPTPAAEPTPTPAAEPTATPTAEPTQTPAAGQEAQDAPKIPNDQLDSLVAPIALYPDPLLSQVLVASTYPLEIVQLQQWLEQKGNHMNEKAKAEAVAKQDWDPSIQAMAVLPDVVKRLAENVKWTSDLGNAFLAQQGDVMDAVQRMRTQAQNKGNLKSNEQMKVETKVVESKTVVVIEQASPEVVYVPSYNPTVVWGAMPYPYPPVYYPPAGYYAGRAIGFGVGVAVGAAWGGGGWGWGAGWGHNDVNVNVNNSFNRNTNISGGNRTNIGNRGGGNTWQHNPQHRGGAPYSNRATATKYGGSARGDSMSSRQATARQNSGGGRQQAGSMDRGGTNRGSGGRQQAGSMDRGGGGGGRAQAGSLDRGSGGGGRAQAGSLDRGSGGRSSGGGGGDRIGSRETSRSSGGSNRGSGSFGSSSSFGGGSFGGGSTRSSSSRGSSSMGSRGGGGGGGGRGGGGGGRGGGGGGGRR